MRYEDASQAGSNEHSETIARPDVETLPPGSFGPATGNAITGQGTSTGASGADNIGTGPATVIAVQGAGGQTSSGDGGFQATGQYGVLSMDAQGNFNYVRSPNSPDGVNDVFNYTLADAAGANASSTLTINIAQAAAAAAGQQGAIALPAGVELSDIHVNGRDLVINMPDGTQMVIPNGAVFVPEITIGDVQVPPTNVAALLVDSEPQPAAGPPPSSGGNWNDPVAPLDPGVPLGDLIPPTELGHTPPTFQEPAQGIDTEPTVIVVTPDFPAGAVDASESVNEKGLPARDGDLSNEPAGSGEIADGNGSNDSDGSETNTGTIVFTAEDGLESITINGEEVTAVGQQIEGKFGTLTITGIDLENGQITYSYTLNDNTSGDTTQDVFAIVVTDDDGDTANGSLTVHIVDDVPTARNDTDSLDLATNTATGNVMTAAGTTSAPGGADTVGADNALVTGVSSNNTGASDTSFDANGNLVVQGDFGTLTIKADGSYVYTADPNAPSGVHTEVFTYTLTDGDGDKDTATLTITIDRPDEHPTVDVPTTGEAGTAVSEVGLPARNGEPEGTGEAANPAPNTDNSEITSGTITYTDGDGASTITIQGTGGPVVVAVGADIQGQYGTLHIDSFDPATHTITYTYTLDDNLDHSTQTPSDEFQVVVSDSDGNSADDAHGTLTISIADDAPIAADDTDSVSEDGPTVASGNVISGAGSDGNPAGGDLVGADDAHVTLVDGLNPGVGQVTADADGETIVGQYGTLIINSDGTYTYTLDNTNPEVQALTAGQHLTESFQYTLHDGDGDDDTAVLTITINGSDDVPTVDVPQGREPGTAVSEVGLPTRNGGEPEGTGEGANPAPNTDNSEITSGTITYTDGDGATTITIQGTGGPVTVAVGADIVGVYGTLHIDSFDPATHTITYTYTLNDNVDHDSQPSTDEFKVVVSDSDGNPADDASGTLTINIADDHPIAVADTDSVTEGHQTSGDVLTGAGGDGNPAGADIPGADDLPANPVVGVAVGDTGANLTNGSGVGGAGVHGTYGTLVLNADGTYTYTADPNTNPPAGATDTFTYTIIDNDGSASHTTITISVIDDKTPSVDVPTAGEAGTSVDEQGLPAHSGRPEGSGEAANPAPGSDQSEITSGTITYTEGDAPATVTIDGVTVVAGANIVGTYGTLHIDSIDTTTHTITYTYTLTNNVDNDSQPASDSFSVVVSDSDGNPADDAHATLTIDIVDDGPIARDDTDSVVEGHQVSGDVLTGAGGDGNPAGADTPGADDYAPNHVVGVAVGYTNSNLTNGSGVGGAGVHGTYGTLVLNADGTYTYTADPNTNPPDGATDVFTYTIIDNDGTASNATITIDVIDDKTPSVHVPTTGEAGTSVDEQGLPAHSGRPEGSGEAANPAPGSDQSEITSGTITYTEGDAPATVTIDGVTVVAGADIIGTYGTLHIDSIDTTTHTITYTYTLTNNVDNDTQTPSDSFAVVVSDSDGNPADDAHATLTIDIVDDGPIARDDTDSVIEGAGTGGNVLTGVGGDGNAAGADTPGADGYAPSTVVGVAIGDTNANLTNGSGVGGTGVHGTYGTLVLNANGTYTYTADSNTNPPPGATDTFTYTIIDNDGTASNATLTITVVDDAQPQIGTPENLAVDEDGLGTANLDNGDAGEVDHGGNDTDTGTVTVDFGTDRPGTTEAEWLAAIQFINPNSLDGDLTQNGVPIDFSIDASGNLVGKIGGTTIITISITGAVAGAGGNVTYTYTVDLDGPVDQLPGDNTEGSVVLSGIQFQVTDADGDPASSSFSVTVYDDVPSLGTIDDGTANNDPNSAVTTGSLPYTPSADGTDTIVITPDLTGITSDGHQVIGEMTDANTFTAYIDDDGTPGISNGDTVVFTIDVDPVAGTYTFDLQHPLDGDEQDVVLGSSTSFGVGPSDSIIVSQTGLPNLVFVKGYHADVDFDFASWSTGGTVPSDQLVNGGVNGSTAGWGVDSNNFDAGTFMRFDFGDLDDYDGAGPYTPPGDVMQLASKATFDLFNYDSNDHIYFLAHYSDGSTQLFSFVGTGQHTPAVITAPDGLTIEWIDVYTPDAGSGKVDLESITIISTTVDTDIPVSVTITDGDGDQVSADFNINVADGNTPSSASAVMSSSASMKTMSVETSSLSASNDNSGHQHEARAFAAGNGAAVMAALAAAGLEADQMKIDWHAIAQAGNHAPEMVPLQTAALSSISLHSAGTVAPTHIVQSTPGSHAVQAGQSSHFHDVGQQALGISHGEVKAFAGTTDLLHGSDGPAHGPAMHAGPVMAPTVTMPSAHQLAGATATNAAAKPAEGVQHNEVVGKVLADSLNGGEGHGPNIDALLSGPPGHGGSHDVLEALASHAASAAVGHTAIASAFTGGHAMFSMMHHDAAPPAHG